MLALFLSPNSKSVDFEPFAGSELTSLVPLSASQAELWLACQLGGDDARRAYNESVSLRLRGPLQVPTLRAALAALTHRHEALRASCSADGRLLCVQAELPVELAYHDLSAQAEPDNWQAQALATYAGQQARHVFDLVQGPLWQASLLQLGVDEYHFTFTAHHLICDGWSLGVLLHDLGQLYGQALGTSPPLPPAAPFSAYVAREAAWVASPAYQQAEAFWTRLFADGGPVLRLPLDAPPSAVRSYQSCRLDRALDPALVAGLRALGTAAGCSFITTLLAVFEVLLHRLTGQEDLVVGLPTAGQAALDLPTVVGHCVNLLPLRSQPRGSLPFLDYLRTRKGEVLDALEHQQLTYGRLLARLPRPPREASRPPLVAVVFNADLGLDDGVAFAGLTHELVSNPRAFENFELSLNVSGRGNALVLECAYNTTLFRAERIERLLASFGRVAEQVVARPTTQLADLQLVSPPLPVAYQQLNATQIDFPTATLHELLAAQARVTPAAVAVRLGSAALTYAELEHRANQLAAALRPQLPAGAVAGVAVERGPDLLVALLAVLKCGAAYLPLDSIYPAERLAFMLADSGAQLLLTSAGGLPALRTPTPRLVLEEVLAGADPDAAPPASASVASGADLCYLLYTSGSTGQPKGVAVTHRNVVNLLTSLLREPGLTATDRLLAITTISFDIAVLELFLPLLCGGTVLLADAYTARDGRALLHLLESEHITVLQATPSTWQLLLAAGWERPLPLRALCGGEPLTSELAERLLARCQRGLWNMYAPTETTVYSTVQRVEAGANPVTVGRPLANTQLYILDENREPVPSGTRGEVYIGGAGVARGYWQRPALTAERFVPDPYAPSPGATMYRTGDAGVLQPSGQLQLLGRLDDQLKLRGHRIEPGEIETRLTQLPGIQQAAVTARPRPDGQDVQLVACVVLAADARPDPAAYLAALRTQLPAYLVPARVEVLDALPQLPNGKLDRAALRQPAALPAPAPALAPSYVAPRTDVEQQLANLWASALGVEQVGVYDNFFDLGGHSLIAVQVMGQLEKQTGQRLPLASLFTHSTVAALALLLQPSAARLITWDSLVPIKPTGSKTPLYLVHGGGLNVLLFSALARNLDTEQPVYGLQAKGLDGVEEPLRRLEDMAAHYLAAIRAQNPHGPYALAGYSFGGLIAFEMARQLLAQGQQVRLLAMFDTYADQSNHRAPRVVRLTQNATYTLKQTLFTLKLLLQAPRRTLTYHQLLLGQKLAHLAHRLGFNQGYQPAWGYPQRIDELNAEAVRHYVLQPIPVAVELFRASTRTFYMPDAEYLGWRSFAQGGVRVHAMPGEHNYMFAPPHDKSFAALLQARLDAVAT